MRVVALRLCSNVVLLRCRFFACCCHCQPLTLVSFIFPFQVATVSTTTYTVTVPIASGTAGTVYLAVNVFAAAGVRDLAGNYLGGTAGSPFLALTVGRRVSWLGLILRVQLRDSSPPALAGSRCIPALSQIVCSPRHGCPADTTLPYIVQIARANSQALNAITSPVQWNM